MRPSVILLRRSAVLLFFLLLLLCTLGTSGCASTTYTPRPHRFDASSPVAVETERVAQRMRGNTETIPAFVDVRTGTVYGEWRAKGASASITLMPPGERHSWIIQRYRAFVRPNGWGSSVYVDLEQVECDADGFTWSTTELRGDCRPINEMTETQLRTLDQIGASLRG